MGKEIRVDEFLRKYGLQALVDRTKVKVVRHPQYNNLVLLKYNMIKSPMADLLTQQCRGIILDEDNDWRIVSFPYTKFFNSGEGHAHPINWDTSRVYEKLDGSLINLHYYDDSWHVSTNGSPDASGSVTPTSSITFKQLFWEVFYELGYNLPVCTKKCYMFELMTPDNRVVIPHDKSRLVLHGARNVSSWSGYKEVSPETVARDNGWECVETFDADNLQAVLAMAADVNGMECEGFVVCDENFNRQKIKSKAYVALHHLKSSLSKRRILEVIQTNEGSEFLTYFPAYAGEYNDIKRKFTEICEQAERDYSDRRHIKCQKEFAMSVKSIPYAGALFAVRAGRVPSFLDWFSQYDTKKMMKLLKIKEEKGQAFFRK